jgi:rare lipoprotein A
MKKHQILRLFLPMALCALLSACVSHQGNNYSNTSPPAEGSGNPVYKVGQPYQIGGEWYYPKEDYSYDETGIASWYGADFHNQRTSNGEIFNKDELTAAHKTLPMPSLARVTNLDNGRSIVVRVNDRGPFSGARIIDVSQRAAQLLGFEGTGTAKVRVQVLADESKAIADAMRRYGGESAVAAAATAPEQVATSAPEQLAPAPTQLVQSETLEPVKSTPATHQLLMQTEPVAEVVQFPVTTHTQIYVQAGAFKVVDNAQRLQQSLAGLGKTSVSQIVINGVTFYRVRVGPVSNVAQADALLSKVKQSGATAARTVVD